MKNKKIALFICGAKRNYPRNIQILRFLKEYFKVIEITSNKSFYLLRLSEVLGRFLFSVLFQRNYDLIFIGFLGQPLMPVVKLLVRGPIIFDALVSIYDTLCLDRKSFNPNSIVGKITFWLDKKSFQWAQKIVTDSKTHTDYFSKLFDIEREKFQILYNIADERLFYPRETKKTDKFTIFFDGTFLPLHGIDYIVRAARLLGEEKDILFRIVGKGKEKNKILKLAEDLNIKNIEFIDWIPHDELPSEIAKADLCLGGHFSNIDKAKRVISGKAFQYLAMKKPIIVGDNPAVRELFIHREDVYMCKMADEKALAGAILELRDNKVLREKIAERGFETFKQKCNFKQARENLLRIIED